MNLETVQRAAAIAADDGPPALARSPLYVGPTSATKKRLRVVLVAPPLVAHWLDQFLTLAAQCDWIDLVVQPLPADRRPPTAARIPFDLRAYLTLDRLRHPRGSTMRPVAIQPRAGINIQPEFHAGANGTPLRARIEAFQPDLILWAAVVAPVVEIGEAARVGCWTLDGSLIDPDRAGLPLLQPVLLGEDAAALQLELASGDADPLPVAKVWSTSWPGSFTLHRDEAFLKLPALLLRALRQLAGAGFAGSCAHGATLRLAPLANPFRAGAGLRAFATAVRRIALWQLEKRRPEDPWFLLVRHDRARLDPAAPVLGPVSALLARPDEYWADPCVVDSAHGRFVFVEEYPTRTRRAVIACVELLPDGTAQRLGIALDEPFHLSYPQAFNSGGEWYLTVESGAARRVSLYRARAFPLEWQRLTDLLTGCLCVDPTLHHHEGRWYLFVNISESGGSTCDELFLFVAEELAGPYHPHPLNPIVTDVRRARSAGRLFAHGGRLIRPSQDCAASYGAAIVFNEVLELGPEVYRERPLARLDASCIPGLDGCHTYSAANGIEVLDARGRLPAAIPRMVVVDAAPARDQHEVVAPMVVEAAYQGAVVRYLAG